MNTNPHGPGSPASDSPPIPSNRSIGDLATASLQADIAKALSQRAEVLAAEPVDVISSPYTMVRCHSNLAFHCAHGMQGPVFFYQTNIGSSSYLDRPQPEHFSQPEEAVRAGFAYRSEVIRTSPRYAALHCEHPVLTPERAVQMSSYDSAARPVLDGYARTASEAVTRLAVPANASTDAWIVDLHSGETVGFPQWVPPSHPDQTGPQFGGFQFTDPALAAAAASHGLKIAPIPDAAVALAPTLAVSPA
jgi:hypothetical protein